MSGAYRKTVKSADGEILSSAFDTSWRSPDPDLIGENQTHRLRSSGSQMIIEARERESDGNQERSLIFHFRGFLRRPHYFVHRTHRFFPHFARLQIE